MVSNRFSGRQSFSIRVVRHSPDHIGNPGVCRTASFYNDSLITVDVFPPFSVANLVFMIAKLVSGVVGTHAALSAASILSGALATNPTNSQNVPKDEIVCESCTKERFVKSVIGKMYRGGGVDNAGFADDLVFDDAMVSCVGRPEVQEAFRALRAAGPELVVEPKIVPDPSGKSGVAMLLHRRYFGSVELHTMVIVQTGADGRVNYLEERWNQAPLLDVAPVRWSRRLNGIVSRYVTPHLV